MNGGIIDKIHRGIFKWLDGQLVEQVDVGREIEDHDRNTAYTTVWLPVMVGGQAVHRSGSCGGDPKRLDRVQMWQCFKESYVAIHGVLPNQAVKADQDAFALFMEGNALSEASPAEIAEINKPLLVNGDDSEL